MISYSQNTQRRAVPRRQLNILLSSTGTLQQANSNTPRKFRGYTLGMRSYISYFHEQIR